MIEGDSTSFRMLHSGIPLVELDEEFGTPEHEASVSCRFTKGMLSLLADGNLIRRVLGSESKAVSELDRLRGQVAEADKQAEKYLHLIEGEENPSKMLLARLTEWETKAEKLRGQLMEEEANIKGETPVLDTYESLPALADLKPEDRLRLKEGLKGLIDKISINFREHQYEVHFRNGKMPVTVRLGKPGEKGGKNGWCIYPATSAIDAACLK